MADAKASHFRSSRLMTGTAVSGWALARKDAIAAYGLIEVAMTMIAGFVAFIAYPAANMQWHHDITTVWFAVFVMGLSLSAWSLVHNHYQTCISHSGVAAVGTAFTASICSASILLAFLFVFKVSESLSRSSLLCFVALTMLLTIVGRVFFNRWSHQMIAAGRMVSTRAIVLGEDSQLEVARDKLGFFDRLHRDGVRVVTIDTWFADGDATRRESLVATVCERSQSGEVDIVIMLPTAASIGFAEQLMEAIAETPLTVHVVPFVRFSNSPQLGTSIGGQSSILIANSSIFNASAILKRIFDVIGGLSLLVLLMPLLAGIALAIKLDSPGPVFFRQTRHGYGNSHFEVFKFRSMRVMEDGAAFCQAMRNDPRVTRVGHFIRRSNLDELPQLLNVILGDMSLVGPRPHPVALNDDFSTRIRMFNRRHNIRPGITGWAQVNGFRGETDTDVKMMKRVEYDLWYIDHWSFLLDIRIIIFTLVSPAAYKNAG